MEGKENITEYRDKLDKTLKSDDLCNVEFLKKLVENQLSKSSQHEDQGLYSYYNNSQSVFDFFQMKICILIEIFRIKQNIVII